MASEKLPKQHATNGKFMRTPEQIQADRKAADLRSLGYTYQMIADRMDVSVAAAHRMVDRAIQEIPTEGTEQVRKMELEKLDNLERRLIYIINQPSYKTSTTGRVVEYEGKPVLDPGPQVQAITAALRVIDKRAKLLGLDAPTKVETEMTIYDGTGEVERELYERAVAWRRWQADGGGESDRPALPLGGQGEAGAEASDG
jgi:hypothetical protein